MYPGSLAPFPLIGLVSSELQEGISREKPANSSYYFSNPYPCVQYATLARWA